MLEFHDAVELYRKAAEQADQNDPVNHPSHYASGGIECISAIEAQLSPEEFQGYLRGNVVKYVWRWREKGGSSGSSEGELVFDQTFGKHR